MPLLPACLTEPLWVEFAALIGSSERSEFSPARPWGCHRRRIGDRVVFDHVLAALVHGSGYERIAAPGCSDRTIRRRLVEWAEAGVGQELLRIGDASGQDVWNRCRGASRRAHHRRARTRAPSVSTVKATGRPPTSCTARSK